MEELFVPFNHHGGENVAEAPEAVSGMKGVGM